MLARFLTVCRYVLILAVLGCVIVSAGIVVLGMGRLITTTATLVQQGDLSGKTSKELSLAAIEIIDLFLVATVAYITAVGLYSLFISGKEVPMPVRLKITTLEDLEAKIIGVLVVALAVLFLGQAACLGPTVELLYFGAGMALVIGALAYFLRCGGK